MNALPCRKCRVTPCIEGVDGINWTSVTGDPEPNRDCECQKVVIQAATSDLAVAFWNAAQRPRNP